MSRSTDFIRRRSGGAERHGSSEGAGSPYDEPLGGGAGQRAVGESYEEHPDWGKLGAFGAGLAIGAALGAGTALLFAPSSGEDTRERIGLHAKHLGADVADRWDDLRGEIHWLGRRGRKSIRRGMLRSRWAAEDALDRGRRKWG